MNDSVALRPRLFGIAYRILGSVSDAEDIVQTAYVRLEEHRDDDIHDAIGWLVTVTARLAIDRARAVTRERERYVGQWLPEPLIEADPADDTTRSDDLTMGFLRLLERLRPEERTAMLLHDVFDYSHAEIASMLEKTVEAVRQMTVRARQRVRAERPRIAVDRRKAAALVERFLQAVREGNVDELRAVLATDVVQIADGGGVVNAGLNPVVGIERSIRLLVGLRKGFWSDLQANALVVNSLPGAGLFSDNILVGTIAFDFSADRITALYVVVNPGKLPARPAPGVSEHG